MSHCNISPNRTPLTHPDFLGLTFTSDWKVLAQACIFSMRITIIMLDLHRVVIIREHTYSLTSAIWNIIKSSIFLFCFFFCCSKHCVVSMRCWAQALIKSENGSYLHPLSSHTPTSTQHERYSHSERHIIHSFGLWLGYSDSLLLFLQRPTVY